MRKQHRTLLNVVVATLAGSLAIGLSLAVRVWLAGSEPFFPGKPKPSDKSACRANLMLIDGAKATWALETSRTTNDIPVPSNLYGVNAYIRDRPMCPSGGAYDIRRVGAKPTCTLPGHTL